MASQVSDGAMGSAIDIAISAIDIAMGSAIDVESAIDIAMDSAIVIAMKQKHDIRFYLQTSPVFQLLRVQHY